MHTDTLIHCAERIQGIPAIAPLYGNDCFVCILIICFFIIAAVLSSREAVLDDTFSDFFLLREHTKEGVKTTQTLYMRLGLFLVSLVSTSLFLTAYLLRRGVFDVGHSHYALLTLSGLLLGAYLLKQVLFRAVNWVFFDKSQTSAWYYSYANWVILSGALMFLVALLSVFFDLSLHAMSIFGILYIILVEIGLFYKAFHIFYAKRYGLLQLFVYLCTLELMPLLLAGKALVFYV